MNQAELRNIPGVDHLLEQTDFPEGFPEALRKRVVREVVSSVRERIKGGEQCPPQQQIVERILDRCQSLEANRIRPVVNATGVILHTNLGRAPIPRRAIRQQGDVIQGYSNLELDLESGGRGGRGSYGEILLHQITGAPAAGIVNNCSAALVLALKAITEDRDVLISRGELVQIGGGFRIPEILEESGATLKEVGTTNRTVLHDYRRALSDDTGMILRVHRSNFDLIGFTGSPSLEELSGLAREHGIPLVCDLGSGAHIDTEDYGLKHEKTPKEVYSQGADLVTFSGDKLLGGPQAGIFVGREDLVKSMKNHPLFRAMRCDKSILSSLETVLTLYATDQADELPVYRLLSTGADKLRARAGEIREALGHPDWTSLNSMDGAVGGGALPSETIPSAGLVLNHAEPEDVMGQLREYDPPIVGRIKEDRVHLNLRTVFAHQDETIVEALRNIPVDSS